MLELTIKSIDRNASPKILFFELSLKMIKFFKPEKKLIKKFNKYKTHDQTYINKNKNKLNYEMLPLKHFPNGAHFRKFKDSIDPFIIHYNYILGHEKKNEMIKDNNCEFPLLYSCNSPGAYKTS